MHYIKQANLTECNTHTHQADLVKTLVLWRYCLGKSSQLSVPSPPVSVHGTCRSFWGQRSVVQCFCFMHNIHGSLNIEGDGLIDVKVRF